MADAVADFILIPWSLDAQLFCVISNGLAPPGSFFELIFDRGVTFGAFSPSFAPDVLSDGFGKVLELECLRAAFLALAPPVSSLFFLEVSKTVDLPAISTCSLLLLGWA